MEYHFEWDPRKAKSNVKKHGVRFEQAAEVFWDALQLTVFDDQHSETEERWVTLGKTKQGTLLVVVHTFAEHHDSITVRIIWASAANCSAPMPP